MPLADDQNMIQALTPKRSDQASGICGECWLHIRLITTSRARTWRWRRTRRYGGPSRGAERSSPPQFFPDCTIAMCGYDFREGQEGETTSSVLPRFERPVAKQLVQSTQPEGSAQAKCSMARWD